MKSFCLSPMKFFSLRLDRFTQFLYTSSVIVSLEFVSPDFRLTVNEDLLPLSVQKSPNLCVFSVQFLTSFHNGLPSSFVAFCHSFDNGLPRSIGHGRRRLTNRQAFSLGVIDLFSVCIEEHLSRLWHRRNPRPRGTVARRTVARSWTLRGTRRKSP